MKRRVVITGLGLVTPFGSDVEQLWQSLLCGQSAVQMIEQVEDIEGSVIGAPVTGFSPRAHVDVKSLRLMTPAVVFGVAAAQLAVLDSGLDVGALNPARVGIFVGSRGHSSDRHDLLPAVRTATHNGRFHLDRFGAEGLPLVHPMWLLKGLANNVLYFLSLKYSAQGMNNNISMGAVGGTMAIGEAFHAIQRGYLDVALAGGYDSALDADRLELFRASGLLARSERPSEASRPFDRRRNGFVPSEGASFLLLETLESAQTRGARLYGELLGYGCGGSGDGLNLGPSASGFASALAAALADAGGCLPNVVFTHGLATPASDAAETEALKQLFGARARTIPAPALKSMIGHTLAASGPIEAVGAVLSLGRGSIPPTINLTESDQRCDLDYVAGKTSRRMELRTAALNNANFGGAHAALLLGRVD